INGSQDAWEFFDEVNNTYLKPRSGNNNGLQGGNNVETAWTISIASNNIVTIVAKNSLNFSRRTLQFNYISSNPIFACYDVVKSESNYKLLFLYKEIVCTDPELTFVETAVTKTAGDAPFTNLASSSVSNGAITYSSDDTAVATVDANTGEVTIVAAGETEIKASIAADGEFCAEDISYTLTVDCTDPELAFETTGDITKTVGDAPFTNPASSSVSSGVITYSSDDTDVATVDANTGEVTIVAAGETEIKASIAADGEFCAGDISYTLTVNECIVDTPTTLTTDPVAHDGFTANWEAVGGGATEYELSVYTGETSIELDVNGDFENWTEGKPDSWIGAKSNLPETGIAQYSTSVQSGNYALQLIRTQNTHQRFSSKAVSVTNGEYTITFWVRGHGDIRTGLFDARSDGGGYSEYNDYINVNSIAWEEHTQTVKVTNETDDAEFIFSVKSTNADKEHIQIDNVRIAKNVPPAQIPNSPFTTTETSYSVTGLDAETEYFYVVRAIVPGCGESGYSSPVMVKTLKAPSGEGLNEIEKLHLYVADGQIHFEAAGGEPVEVFNAVGQKIMSQTAASGKNSIAPNAKGVLIVKVGKEINKVIF
ncbi:MAG: Ig-like domain-containing protein, partial [Tannerella sp.]|nr:Ig-like domain-containing protein [Tannerella sp.]